MNFPMTSTEMVITIAVVVLATVTTRFIPYLLFPEGKQVPKFVLYLGKVLAPAVFGLLVVYCFRNTPILTGNHGIPELISTAAVILLYLRRRGMVLPMAGGTILYMFLVQVVFKG